MKGAAGTRLLNTNSLRSSSALAALTAMLCALPNTSLMAQDANGSVSSYRLPDPTSTQSPLPSRAPGPVDPDKPFINLPPPRISEPETPSPTSQPAISKPEQRPNATQKSAPANERQRPATAPSPIPTPIPTPSDAATFSRSIGTLQQAERSDQKLVEPSSAPSDGGRGPASDQTVERIPQPTALPVPVARDGEKTDNWLLPAAAGAGLLAGTGYLLMRRRRGRAEVASTDDADRIETEPAMLDRPSPLAIPTPSLPTGNPLPHPRSGQTRSEVEATVPTPQVAASTLDIKATFFPKAIRLSLVFATVQYELEIANEGEAPLPEINIHGDLGAAHASLGTREQLAPRLEQMEVRHTVLPIAPGETARVKGEVRVPLQQIPTITKGTASFFIPLARFAFTTDDERFARRVFTLGSISQDRAAIMPVRLDAGPRNLRELSSREIEAARGFPLDPDISQS